MLPPLLYLLTTYNFLAYALDKAGEGTGQDYNSSTAYNLLLTDLLLLLLRRRRRPTTTCDDLRRQLLLLLLLLLLLRLPIPPPLPLPLKLLRRRILLQQQRYDSRAAPEHCRLCTTSAIGPGAPEWRMATVRPWLGISRSDHESTGLGIAWLKLQDAHAEHAGARSGARGSCRALSQPLSGLLMSPSTRHFCHPSIIADPPVRTLAEILTPGLIVLGRPASSRVFARAMT